MSADQIQDQYEYAMKLHMGNKINDKNVFSLNLNLAACIFQRYQKWVIFFLIFVYVCP